LMSAMMSRSLRVCAKRVFIFVELFEPLRVFFAEARGRLYGEAACVLIPKAMPLHGIPEVPPDVQQQIALMIFLRCCASGARVVILVRGVYFDAMRRCADVYSSFTPVRNPTPGAEWMPAGVARCPARPRQFY